MTIKTTATEVQVYRTSATVTKNGEVTLTKGRNLFTIAGLTATAKQDSFRLKFPEKIRAINLQIVREDRAEKTGKTEDEQLKDEIDELGYRIETTDLLIDRRKINADFSHRTAVGLAEQEQFLTELPEKLLALYSERKELIRRKTEKEKALSELEKKGTQPLILAEIFSEEEGTVPFILQYQEMAAGWTPKYEIQYHEDKAPLDVRMKAKIFQSTKEDWKKVKVALYTGNPSVSTSIPEQKTIQLSLLEPVKDRSALLRGNMVAKGAVMDSVMMGGMAMAAAAAPMGMLQMSQAAVTEEETMTAYELPDQRDIYSDTEGNMADLQYFSVKADYRVLSIPGVDSKCYMTAEIVSADWPLPPATASVYLRDTLAGDVYVDATSDTDLFTLSLGPDERLTVVRTELPKKTQDIFLKNQKKQTCTTVIRLVSNSSEPVKLLVKDQIPVSLDKALVVEPVELSGGVLSDTTGEVRWEISAEPKKSQELTLSYNISWPKDKKIRETRADVKEKSRFCNCCGRPVSGKFCPECGTLVE